MTKVYTLVLVALILIFSGLVAAKHFIKSGENKIKVEDAVTVDNTLRNVVIDLQEQQQLDINEQTRRKVNEEIKLPVGINDPTIDAEWLRELAKSRNSF
jgi:DNA repair ATPase RecN